MSASRATAVERTIFKIKLSKISESYIAWFSGWLCGDGCISVTEGRPKVKFALCDADPLRLFSALFGNSVSGPYPPSGLGKRSRYEWSVSGWKARLIITRCLPWLSERYTLRAEKALACRILRQHAGRTLSPSIVVEIRRRLRREKGVSLASEFEVSSATISAIKHNRIWKQNPH